MTDIILRIQTVLGSAVTEVAKFRESITATEVATGDLRETWKATTAEIVVDARKQIAAEKEKVDQIRAEINSVLELSDTYTKGSDERQLATKMEIDLQRKLQHALGETAAVASKTGRAAGVGTAESDLSGIGRGAASRSGVAGMGMSALAGPGFIAGAVVGGVLDYSVKAAKADQIAQANLANALRDTGQARRISKKALDEYVASEEHATGFQRDDVMQTLSQLIRSTGSLAKARQEEAVMANVARARNTDLSGAMMLVLRAAQGNTGSLKRLGIDIQKVTTYEDQLKAAHLTGNVALAKRAKALDLAATRTEVMNVITKKFAGDSSAYMNTFGGETAKLSNEWRDLETEIGQKAIPVLTQLFGWLEKEIQTLEHSKAAHQDLHDAVDALRIAFDSIKTVVETVNKATGGFGSTLKLLLTYFAVSKVLAFANAIDKQLAAAFGNAESSAAGAATQSSKVLTNLRNLARMAAITIGIDLLFQTKGQGSKGLIGAMLTGAAVGSMVGGGLGALIGGGTALTIDVLLQDGTKGGADQGGVSVRYKGVTYYSVKGSPGEADLRKIAERLQAGEKLTKQELDLLKYLRTEPGASSASGGVGDPGSSMIPGQLDSTSRSIRQQAGRYIGGTYVSGGGHGAPGSPKVERVLDCSGFVFQALTAAGLKGFSNGNAASQYAACVQGGAGNWRCTEVGVDGAQAGDVVYYNIPSNKGEGQPSHCGIVAEGSGRNAMVMQYYGTGAGSGSSKILDQPGTVMGVFRFVVIAGKHAGTAAATDAGTGTSSTFGGAVSRAAAQAAAQAAAAHGLKEPGLIAIKAAINAELRSLPAYLDPAEKEAVRHIRELEKSLRVGMSSTDLARDKAALARWGKNLKDEIARQAKEIQIAWSGDLARIGQQVAANWAARKQAFDQQTQAGMQGLVVAQTPEEKALADYQAQIAAQQEAATKATLQSDLAAAIASGDTVRIKAAQDAINAQLQQDQLAALQKAADASRVAQDAKTASAQAAYQKERDAQWKHLQAIHDDQVRMFDSDLKLWESALEKKAKTWQQFLRWLAHNPISGAFDGSSLQNPLTYGSHHHKNVPKHAAGAIHVRPTIGMFGEQGPEATIPLSGQHGQRAIGQLAEAIVAAAAGMGAGGGVTVYGTFLGATEKQVGRALEGLVTPAQRRVVRYPAPL